MIHLQRGLVDAEKETLLLLHSIPYAEVENTNHNVDVHCQHIGRRRHIASGRNTRRHGLGISVRWIG